MVYLRWLLQLSPCGWDLHVAMERSGAYRWSAKGCKDFPKILLQTSMLAVLISFAMGTTALFCESFC